MAPGHRDGRQPHRVGEAGKDGMAARAGGRSFPDGSVRPPRAAPPSQASAAHRSGRTRDRDDASPRSSRPGSRRARCRRPPLRCGRWTGSMSGARRVNVVDARAISFGDLWPTRSPWSARGKGPGDDRLTISEDVEWRKLARHGTDRSISHCANGRRGGWRKRIAGIAFSAVIGREGGAGDASSIT